MATSFLYEILRSGFAGAPERAFLRVPGRAALSFASVEQRAMGFSAALREAGVAPGDRVVVQVGKSPDAVALYLACLRVGAVFVPLNPAYSAREVAFALDDAEPALFVGGGSQTDLVAAQVERAHGAVRTLGADGQGTLAEAAARLGPDPSLAERGEGDVAAMLYTSGTTGRPKGALLSHGNLASNARTLHVLWGFRPGEVVLHSLPIFHAHGLFVALHCALLNGSEVLFHERFDARAVVESLPEASVFMGVPTFYARLLAEPAFDRECCRTVRLFVSGSAPLSERVFREFEARSGQRILERYGMTETAMIASNPLDGVRVAGTVGFALPGVEIDVRNGEGASVAAGAVGTVFVRGPNVFRGYWRRPQKTRAELGRDGFFRTGDLGRLDSDGRLSLVGRESDLIISGGLNVYPSEVEQCLDELPGVAESAVVGLPHDDLGEAVTAFVVSEAASSGAAPRTTRAVRAALADRLAGFKCPRRVVWLDALPRNAMGKVEKAQLRGVHAALYAAESGVDGEGRKPRKA